MQESVYINGDGTVPGAIQTEGTFIKVYPLRSAAYQLDLWTGDGGHGGGDPVLQDDIFAPVKPEDPYKRAADQRSGAYSILIGAAANISFKTGNTVVIDDLVKGIGTPEYPPMPTHAEPLLLSD